jgi:ribosome-associated protein
MVKSPSIKILGIALSQQSVEKLKEIVVKSLDDLKVIDPQVLNVTKLTSMADYMIVASGTSDRHLKALANSVAVSVKEAGYSIRSEGEQTGDWILLDLGDIIVHLMLPKTRDFYNIEGLWRVNAD